jgi:hypothetical protein
LFLNDFKNLTLLIVSNVVGGKHGSFQEAEMNQKKSKATASFNPFSLRAGTTLQLVNREEKIIGTLILKKDADIVLGFAQENQEGVLIFYKTVTCCPAKGIYCVRAED